MKLQQLELLCMLEQYPSFTQAATHLFISQPALSTSLQTLEKELNCKLLSRNNKGIEFTPAGRLALEKAHDILNEILLIRSTTIKTNLAPKHITIGGNTLACIDLLLKIYLEIEKNYPQITVNLQDIDEHSLIHQLTYNILDFALLQINSMNPEIECEKISKKYNLHLKNIANNLMGILVSKNHPLKNKQHISISDVFDYPFTTAHIETDYRIVSSLNKLGFCKEPFVIQDTFCLNQLISNSHYWAIISQQEILRHQADPQNPFIFLYPNDFTCYSSIYWLSTSHNHRDEELLLLQTIQQILNM